MQKYEYVGTIFIMANWTGKFEGRDLMTFENAREMQNNGWEVGSHTLSHRSLNLLDEYDLEKELKQSKEILEKEGFFIYSLAYPFGEYNKNVKEEAKKYYFAQRPMKWGYNYFGDLDSHELKSKLVMKKHSSEEVCSWIKEAEEKDLWLILNFHFVEEIEITPWDVSIDKFKEILGCINNTDIKIKTIKEVLDDEKRI